MSNFVGTLLSICIHFFSCILKILLILILNKLVYSYIFPLDKTILEDFENASPYFCTFLANRICD